MATTTVHFQDAVSVIISKYSKGTNYKYADISTTLIEAFPKINKSQISGLITRLVDSGYFDKHKEPGARYDYIFKGKISPGENNKNIDFNTDSNLHTVVQSQIIELADKLNSLKTGISTPDEFLWLQNKIDNLYKIAKE